MAHKTPLRQIAIAALAAELPVSAGQPPAEFRLFPAGRFRSVDGRPERPAKGWLMDARVAARLIDAAKARKSDYVIDYEHQTLHAAKNGQPAPAAAWFHDLEWREGDGLYCVTPTWTAAAAAHVAAREYRYVSPVFTWDKDTGEVLKLLHGALVNDPGIDGLTDFSALRAFGPEGSTHGGDDMDLLEKLLGALGLPADADAETGLATVTALKAKAGKADALTTEVAALKASAPDPARFVSVETMRALQTEVAALKTQLQGGEVDGLVKTALAESRLLPAQETWARELGGKDVAALKSYLGTVTPNPALAGKTQTEGKGAGSRDEATTLSVVELAVCKATGTSAEDFLKTKQATAA
ncbi:phage protease [Rhodocyclus tenuis]|uniref:Phage I-like protein n=1 Tax=Rhodocyclus tenuis TaxID=1066 RepID=A0A840G5T9_RHOTE|nr:phage protease [Rhodocyclus tenuis]MBB4247255.1 phage I-like protein [Rhodocyclus tenuis]